MVTRRKAQRFADALEGRPAGQREAHEPALDPLLDLAQQLRALPRPELDPATLAAGSVRVRVALATRRQALAGRRAGLRRLAWVAVALSVAVLLATTGTVWAAESSLPGQPLYPVKRAAEEVRLALTWQRQARADLRVSFVERRLAEVTAVCASGVCPPGLLPSLGEQTEAAEGEIEGLPEGKRAAPLERMVALTLRQQDVLTQVLEGAPPASRPGLERALLRSRQGHERAQEALQQSKRKEVPRDSTASPAAPQTPGSPKGPQGPKPTKDIPAHGPEGTPKPKKP